jgi:hypothetical protein
MSEEICPVCLADVIELPLHGNSSGATILVDRAPTPKGTCVIMNGEIVMLSGPKMWAPVKRYGIPTYRRHGISCPNWWLSRMLNRMEDDGTQ